MEDLYRYKYKKYKHKYTQLRKRAQTGGGEKGKKLECLLFKAEWCGHCQQFKPAWEALKTMYGGNPNVTFKTYDSDQDEHMMEQYGIEAFPTIIFENKNGRSFYKGSREIDAIMNMIDTYLGK